MNLREQLFSYVKKKYNAAPEYLWMRFPDYAVFRHADNGKWFGIVMNVSGEKLSIDNSDDKVDILNVKLPDPLLAEMMKIRLLKRYPPDRFTFQRLKDEYNIYAVRGSRGVPHALSEDLNFS